MGAIQSRQPRSQGQSFPSFWQRWGFNQRILRKSTGSGNRKTRQKYQQDSSGEADANAVALQRPGDQGDLTIELGHLGSQLHHLIPAVVLGLGVVILVGLTHHLVSGQAFVLVGGRGDSLLAAGQGLQRGDAGLGGRPAALLEDGLVQVLDGLHQPTLGVAASRADIGEQAHAGNIISDKFICRYITSCVQAHKLVISPPNAQQFQYLRRELYCTRPIGAHMLQRTRFTNLCAAAVDRSQVNKKIILSNDNYFQIYFQCTRTNPNKHRSFQPEGIIIMIKNNPNWLLSNELNHNIRVLRNRPALAYKSFKQFPLIKDLEIMGNNNSQLVQAARNKREKDLDEQMQVVNRSLNKLGITPEKARQIASLNVQQAVAALNKGELTSEALVAALAYRASTVGKELNVFIATSFSLAIDLAMNCDLKRKQTGLRNWTFEDGDYNPDKYLPALFGIPISIKDVFHTDTMPTTIGLISRANNYEQQSPIIKCMKNAGMIPYIKTNIPQIGMTVETNNNLWGRTVSPWNKERAVGGSSGGEGAIISSNCSLIGLGSDIGGSIRVPAQFCGIYGLKPCSSRISASFHAVFSRAFQSFGKNVPLCIGPLGKSSKDLALFMDVASREQYYQGTQDAYSKIIPFNYKQFNEVESGKKKYRIGYIKAMRDIEPSHASRRAMEETIEILRKQGHQLFPIEIPNQKEVIRQFIAEYSSTKFESFREILNGEKTIPEYKTVAQVQQMWPTTRFLVSKLAQCFMPRTYTYYLEKSPHSSVMEYQTHMGIIPELKGAWIKYWRQNKIDFAICPGFGCQAFLHGQSELLSIAVFYTLVWNILDMATGSMPVTVVRPDEQVYESAVDDMFTKELRKCAQNSAGLPVGIQVVGLPYEEEKVLGFMSLLEKRIEFSKKHPLPNL